MPDPLRFAIPRPLSLNNAYSNAARRRGRVLTAEGRAYKEEVAMHARLAAARGGWETPPRARFTLTMQIHFATRRRRDLDNCIKLAQDAIASALGFDDTRIDELHIVRGQPYHDAHALITLAVRVAPAPAPDLALWRMP